MATPNQISNLNLWLKGDAGLFTDAARTVAANADAQSIAGWADQSGAGNHASQAALVNRPKKDAIRNLLQFEYGANEKLLLPNSFAVNSQAFSLFFICELANLREGYDGTQNQQFHVFFEANGDVANLFVGESGKLLSFGGGGHYSQLQVPTSRALIGMVCSPSGTKLYVNDLSQDVGIFSPATSTGGIIGSYANASFPLMAGVSDVMAWSRPLSDTEIGDVRDYAASRGVVIAGAENNVIFDGDSITAGVGASLNRNYANFLQLPPLTTLHNIARAGITLNEITAQAAGFVDSRILAGANNVYIPWAATNDFAFTGTTAEGAYNNLKALVSGRIAAGIPASHILVPTTLPRQDSNIESKRIAYNALIRGDASGLGYIVVDVASDTQMGQAGQAANTMFYADGVHPNTAGYGVIAGMIQPHLNAIFPSIVQPPTTGLTPEQAAQLALLPQILELIQDLPTAAQIASAVVAEPVILQTNALLRAGVDENGTLTADGAELGTFPKLDGGGIGEFEDANA